MNKLLVMLVMCGSTQAFSMMRMPLGLVLVRNLSAAKKKVIPDELYVTLRNQQNALIIDLEHKRYLNSMLESKLREEKDHIEKQKRMDALQDELEAERVKIQDLVDQIAKLQNNAKGENCR